MDKNYHFSEHCFSLSLKDFEPSQPILTKGFPSGKEEKEHLRQMVILHFDTCGYCIEEVEKEITLENLKYIFRE